MSADRNRLRITGDPAGNIWVNDIHVFTPSGFAESAAHARATLDCLALLSDTMRELHFTSILAQPGDADALKLSGVRRLRAIVGTLDGRAASEDAIDVNNRCNVVELLVGQLWPARKYCGTIKGESAGIAITVLKQHGHGGETDWDYGNISDQGNAPVRACTLEAATVDGSPVRLRLLSADPVHLELPDDATPGRTLAQAYTVKKLNQGWFYPLYNLLKDLLKKIGIKI